jgi:GT2 family glycosyltransferase
MLPMPTISVVMSVFNGCDFLPEALDSILGQSFQDFEFVIINDGSTDNSLAILESYQRTDKRIRLFSHPNIGLISSLNRGCSLARGKYIARMDADDVAIKDRFAQQVAFMEANPGIGVVGTAVQMIDANGTLLRVVRYPEKNSELQGALIRSNVFWHPTVLLRANVLKSVGGYRNVLCAEDYDLWLRVAESHSLANLPSVLLKYRIHPQQVSHRQDEQQATAAVAAQRSAIFRRSGKQDPLRYSGELTSDTLRLLGVTETQVQTAAGWAYLSRMRNLFVLGQYSSVVSELEMARLLRFALAENTVRAEIDLLLAFGYWRQHRFAKSAMRASRALWTRPIIVGRPFRSVLQRLRSLIRSAVPKLKVLRLQRTNPFLHGLERDAARLIEEGRD